MRGDFMRKLTKIMISVLTILIILTFNTCYATTSITKTDIINSVKKLSTSNSTKEMFDTNSIQAVTDNQITISQNGKEYNINYELNDQAKFSIDVLIEKRMTYEEFSDAESAISLVLVGYLAIANIKNVSIEDSSKYFSNTFNGSEFLLENNYEIVDDINISSQAVTNQESNKDYIYVSEFGNKVIEYTKATYPEKLTGGDNKEGQNNYYELTIERKEVTESSIILSSTMTINVDKDFSNMIGTSNKEPEIIAIPTEEEQPVTIEKTSNQEIAVEQEETELPKTGENDVIYALIGISLITTTIFAIKVKEYKEI